MDRRQFIKAAVLVAAAALMWDANINGGRPGKEDDDEQDPP